MDSFKCVQYSWVCTTAHTVCSILFGVVIYLISYKKVGEDGEES